jgi:hypothetical protein
MSIKAVSSKAISKDHARPHVKKLPRVDDTRSEKTVKARVWRV